MLRGSTDKAMLTDVDIAEFYEEEGEFVLMSVVKKNGQVVLFCADIGELNDYSSLEECIKFNLAEFKESLHLQHIDLSTWDQMIENGRLKKEGIQIMPPSFIL